MESPPQLLNRILVLQPKWLRKIFAGEKTEEIRHQGLSRGFWLVGTSTQVWGAVEIGERFQLTSVAQWKKHETKHCWTGLRALPYKTTWALPVLRHSEWTHADSYQHEQGSVGTAMYRPSRVSR